MAYDNILYINTASISAGWITSSFKGDGSQVTGVPVDSTYSASVSTQLGTKQPNLVTGASYSITSSWANNATTAGTANAISFVPLTATSASWISASAFITTAQTASILYNTNASINRDGTGLLTSLSIGRLTIQGGLITGDSITIDDNVGTITAASVTASLLGTASYAKNAVTASYVSALSVGGILKNKSGIVTSATFAGVPYTATVTFTTAFSDANYSVSITGDDARVWTVESRAASNFIISSNSTQPLTGDVCWVATKNGESA